MRLRSADNANKYAFATSDKKVNDMTMKSIHDSPILVTGAAGDLGAIGRNLTAMLLAKGHKVRALVRREDERALGLRQLGAEVVQGDLTDLASMHRAIAGVTRIYFGMSVSPTYLEATVNIAAVARHHRVEAFVNMSQMTVTQMSITETTPSPQHKLHWLAEQALAWSGLPVVTVRPTVFLEGFFLRLAAAGIRDSDELALPLGNGKTSPISSVDVARAVSVILDDPASHIGHVYNLTGFESADLNHYARVFSEALGRTIRYRNVPLSGWTDTLREFGVSTHLVNHLAVMAELHAQGRYDRMTDDLFKLTGETPMSLYDFVKLHAAEFTPSKATV
ncbi:NmrA family NAD(P)-binding protein [Desmonostoc muscorum LEGE 12446]|nr:NmrA family NAD(P)-binding protein [Desmonostoc muscorum LEGE 12446]